MGALDKMQQEDMKEEMLSLAMRMLENSTSEHAADRQQIGKLTAAVTNLTEYVKVMDEEQTKRMDLLSTSQQHEPPSTPQLDAEMKKRLKEIEKTLASVAQQLSSSAVVKLPDGSSVTRSDLAAYSMMQAITKQQKMMASASDDLADVVRKRGNVRIDTEKLTQHAVKLLDSRLAKAVEAPIQRVEQIVAGLEERVSRLGAEKLAEMTSAAREVIATSEQAERRVERLAGKLTWAMIGQVCQALVPFAVAFIVLGGLVGGASQMLGIGPLLGWTWDSFAAATALWPKALIALGALGGCAGFSWLIWWAGRKLYESYRGW